MKKLIILASVCFPLTCIGAATNYYPDKLHDIIEKKIDITDGSLKSYIRSVMVRYHQKNYRHNDVLVEKCKISNRDSCYRHITLSYKDARRHLFGELHLERDDNGYFVRDVYCKRKIRNSGVGPRSIPNPNVMNCEHTWPQSRFNSNASRSTQKSDLHHLFPTDSRANSTRGDKMFADVIDGPISSTCLLSFLGTPLEVGSNFLGLEYFEPPEAHKGNVARALFYFSTKYNLSISKREEYFLKLWNRVDPVDEAEMARNDKIETFQKSRNPFVDYPELAELIQDF